MKSLSCTLTFAYTEDDDCFQHKAAPASAMRNAEEARDARIRAASWKEQSLRQTWRLGFAEQVLRKCGTAGAAPQGIAHVALPKSRPASRHTTRQKSRSARQRPG